MSYLKYLILVFFVFVFTSEISQANKGKVTRRPSSQSSSKQQQNVRPDQQLGRSTPRKITEGVRPKTDFSISSHNSNTLPQISRDHTDNDLIEAVLNRDLEQVRYLTTTSDIDVNIKDNPTASLHYEMRQFSWTPLMYAVYISDLEMIKLLAMLGANINETNDKGVAALMIAAQQNDLQVIDFLVKAGAKIGLKDDFGRTEIEHAHYGHNYNLVLQTNRLLLGFQNVIENRTELMFASYRGDIKSVQSLVDQGAADINARDHQGWTALMIARLEGHLEVADFLNNAGTEFTTRDHEILINAEAQRQYTSEQILSIGR